MAILKDYEDADVFDRNELYVGKIVDFSINDDFEIQHFTVEGNENMIQHEMGISGSYKLLLTPDKINRKDGKDITLKVEWRELKSIEEIDPDVVKFSNLRNIDVIDSERENIGRILDAVVHEDAHVSFIIGGSPFKEFLKKIGIYQKVHLLLPYRYISRMDSNLIKINRKEEDLGKVLNDIILDADGMRIMDAKKSASYQSRLLLFKESYQDVLEGNEKKSM